MPTQPNSLISFASRRHAPAPRLRCGIAKISSTACVLMRSMPSAPTLPRSLSSRSRHGSASRVAISACPCFNLSSHDISIGPPFDQMLGSTNTNARLDWQGATKRSVFRRSRVPLREACDWISIRVGGYRCLAHWQWLALSLLPREGAYGTLSQIRLNKGVGPWDLVDLRMEYARDGGILYGTPARGPRAPTVPHPCYLTSERWKQARPEPACPLISRYLLDRPPVLPLTTRPLIRRSHSPSRLADTSPFLSPATRTRNCLNTGALKPGGGAQASSMMRLVV